MVSYTQLRYWSTLMTDNKILEACKKGIAAWQQAFNQQDAKGCAEQYA